MWGGVGVGGGASISVFGGFLLVLGKFSFSGGGGNGRWAVFLVSFSDFPNIS